jgi:LPS-assembly lipoprotein
MLLGALATAGCGFTPSFGPGGAADGLRGALLVDEPDTRDAFLLTRRIEDRLGRADSPRYGLAVKLDMTEEPMALTRNNITTRFNIVGRAAWVLRDLADGNALAQDQASSFTGYSATGTTVATLAASRDARARLATILADQIVAQLMAAAPILPE